jgi:hypothetical protein
MQEMWPLCFHILNGLYNNVINVETKLNSVALIRRVLLRPSDRRLSTKLVPTFADRGCRVVTATVPHAR